jgi:hypothetical protein
VSRRGGHRAAPPLGCQFLYSCTSKTSNACLGGTVFVLLYE